MGGVRPVNKRDILILQPARMAEVSFELPGGDDFREAAFPRSIISYPTGGRIDGDQFDRTFGHISVFGIACAHSEVHQRHDQQILPVLRILMAVARQDYPCVLRALRAKWHKDLVNHLKYPSLYLRNI